MQFGFKIAVVAMVVILAMFIMVANLYQNYAPLDETRKGEVRYLFWLISGWLAISTYCVYAEYKVQYPNGFKKSLTTETFIQ